MMLIQGTPLPLNFNVVFKSFLLSQRNQHHDDTLLSENVFL